MNSIGNLLHKRRKAFGADLQEAALWCGMSPKWLEDRENKDDLSSTDFERICRALAISPVELLSGDENSPKRSAARFRAASTTALKATDLRIIATASEIGRTLGDLSILNGKKTSFTGYRDLQGIPPGTEPWDHGYQLGEKARNRLPLLNEPIVNLESTLRRFGIHVIRIKFSDPNIEAASVWESDAVPVILLNTDARQVAYSLSRRAILAHELCHLLHDGGEADIATRMTSAMGIDDYREEIEKRARGFAPAFLAPREWIRNWARTAVSKEPLELVKDLAAHWGLSLEGAIWHAKNSSVIESNIAEQLRTETADSTIILPTDLFETPETDSRLEQLYPELREYVTPFMEGLAVELVLDALENSVISWGRAEELLAWR